MEYRKLGRTGVSVSPLTLGTINFGRPTEKTESIALLLQGFADDAFTFAVVI